MIYQQLFSRVKEPEVVKAGVIGCGDFGSAVVAQGHCVPRLNIQVVADLRIEAAQAGYRLAGVADEDAVICDSRAAALKAMAARKKVILEDAMLMMDLPLHVIVSATRSPEAGARYAAQAIQHGKHLIMVDKEADSVVGPVLKHMADQAGVVFSTDDGDEPGLAIGLVNWARSLGLEVLAAGRARAATWDPAAMAVTSRDKSAIVGEADRWAMARIPEGETDRYIAQRRRLFSPFMRDENCGDPVAHMAVIANSTGLLPDVPIGHRPVVRWRELPDVLCPVEEGGILTRRGVVDTPIILRAEEEPNAGGSVFIVIACDNQHALDTMIQKGLMPNYKHSAAVAYRPYHLCGSETATSIMCAGLLGVPTGGMEIRQHVDIVCHAGRDFRAGEIIGPQLNSGWNPDLQASLAPGLRIGPGAPLPFFMLESNRLAQDVPAGATITWDMVVTPSDSALWSLRQQQDQLLPRPVTSAQ